LKDKLLQIRADEDFLSKLSYLQKINGYKSIAETVRKIVEKEYRKEFPKMNAKSGKWILDGSALIWEKRYICSECKCLALEDERHQIRSNFCHNCGADMRPIEQEVT